MTITPSTPLLKGLRVLDLGRYVAGPYCATLLGYLGAEVIRVERREGSEDRYIHSLFTAEDGSEGEGSLFLQTGCNKRSVTLDLSKPRGREILQTLAASCDIVIANLPPRQMAKLGMDYASLCAQRADAILVNISAFGTRGPDADKGGFDGVGQALSGAMYMTGTPGNPVKAAAPYVDFSTATMAAFGAMAAIMERQRSGRGQEVSATLLGTAMAVFAAHLTECAVLDNQRTPTGNRVQTSAPSDVFATKDGNVLVHVVGDGLFAKVAKLLAHPEWLSDVRFASDTARGVHNDVLCAAMAKWCAARSSAEAIAALEAAGIPTAPIYGHRQALANPQVAAMNLLTMVDYPGVPRSAPVSDLPLSFSGLDTGIKRRPPLLGEDTDAVLADVGYDAAAIAALRSEAVI